MNAFGYVLCCCLIVSTTGRSHAQTCPEADAHAFDFWIGQWDVNNRYLVEGQWRSIGAAEVQVFPVTRACGIVELWDGMMGGRRVRGLSVRSWDPVDSAWTLVLNWPQPGREGFSTLSGTFRHGRGDFYSESRTPEGLRRTRYTFADIGPDRFRWNDGSSSDSGKTWRTQWIMEYSRRADGMRPVLNAALASPEDDPVCVGEEADGAGGLLGRWTAGDGASLIGVRVIGGCAVLAFLEWPDSTGANEVFAVLGHQSRTRRWEAWILSTDHRGFQHLTGETATALAGDRGALRWNRSSETQLMVEWTNPAGGRTALELRRPGS